MSSCLFPFHAVNFFGQLTAKRGEATVLSLFFLFSSSIPKLFIGILNVDFLRKFIKITTSMSVKFYREVHSSGRVLK
jgi:hypothetical protein